MEGSTFLQAISLNKAYPDTINSGVKNINLTIQKGKITAIIGESGSGKSTLLKLLYGLLSPDEGKVYFENERVWGPEVKLIPGHDSMKMVTQSNDDLNLFAKVWENVAALLPNNNLLAKNEKTEAILKQLKMYHLAKKKVVELSGGEKQRVAIARALITNPKVLFLDEPFNQVDSSFREGLQQDIREIVKQTGLTVIIVSHDPAEVLSMADELLVLKHGEIIESGTPKSIYHAPSNLYSAQLLTNCNILNPDEAKICGIKTKESFVVIYPQWIKTSRSTLNEGWYIKQILFKGNYEDLLIEKEGLTLRLLNDQFGKYTEGENIAIKIKNWIGFQ